MRKKVIGLAARLAAMTIFAILFISCGKNNDDDTPPANPNSFTWTFQGNNYTATQDTAFTSGLGLAPFVIYAGTGSSYLLYVRRLFFYLSSFNPGTYTFGLPPGASNTFSYLDDAGINWSGINGSFIITTNSGGRMSGSFSGELSGPGGNLPVSGSFSNMPVKP